MGVVNQNQVRVNVPNVVVSIRQHFCKYSSKIYTCGCYPSVVVVSESVYLFKTETISVRINPFSDRALLRFSILGYAIKGMCVRQFQFKRIHIHLIQIQCGVLYVRYFHSHPSPARFAQFSFIDFL